MHMRLVAAVTASMLTTLGSCKTRDSYGDSGSGAQAIDLGSLRDTGLARIDWACSGKGKRNNAGRNSQEEYCEWTRAPVAFNGQAFDAQQNTSVAMSLAKACVFTTAFDQTRAFFLTQKVVGKPNKFANQADPFWATQFNSYAFLVGGSEPDTGTRRDGIIGHCISGKSCFSPNCVPDRASDPQICQALGQLAKRRCSVDLEHKVAAVVNAGAVPAGRMGDKVVKPQLRIGTALTESCFYAVDPKMPAGKIDPNTERTLVVCKADTVSNCDVLADRINVIVTLKVRDKACVQ